MTTTQQLTLPPTASQARSLNCRKSGSAAALTAVLLWAISVRTVSATGSPAAVAEAPTRCGAKVSGSLVAHPEWPPAECVNCASPSGQCLLPAAALLLLCATGVEPPQQGRIGVSGHSLLGGGVAAEHIS